MQCSAVWKIHDILSLPQHRNFQVVPSVGIRNSAAGDEHVQIPGDMCSSPEQKFRSGISGPCGACVQL